MDYDSSGYKSKKRSEVYSSDNEDSYSTYSEDFEDDSRTSSYEDIKKANRRHQQRRHVKKLSITDESSTTVTSAKKSAQSEPRRRPPKAGVKLGWRSNSFTKDAKRKSGTKDVVAARMMSARRNRINILSNEISEVQSRLDEVLKENKLLKTLQHRQEKALHRFEDTENDLPRLISQHSEEQRVLKARLRKSQDTERVLEGKLRDTNDEMTKMENTLKRLKKMVYDRKLGERSELSRQLASAEDKLYEAERKNKELEKKIELSTSSYMRQINSERSKHKETKDRLDVLHEEYQMMQNKLKEKERALEVSNIYALRVKQSPEKSFMSGKVAVLSPRRIQDKPPPQKHDPSPLPLVPTEEKAAPPPKTRTPTPPTVQSRPPVSTAMTNATDFRKTVRSPDRKSPTLMDIKQPITQDISNDLAGVKIPSKESDWKEDENRGKSVFLTANFESPMITPSNTFISETSNVGNTAPSATQENPANQVENSKIQNGHTLPNGISVAQEIKRKEKQLEVEKKKMEEERKKKAALLAKIKDVEESDSIGTPTGKKNEDSLRQLLSNNNSNQGNPKASPNTLRSKIPVYIRDSPCKDIPLLLPSEYQYDDIQGSLESPRKVKKLYRFPKEVENLHLGIPSTLEQNKKLDPELTFGGYAPTIAPPKRKPRSLTHQKKPASPSGSESDEPMLDLVSGKSKKPESDLLANLFPGQAKQKRKPEQSFVRESSQLKTTPRAKPVHSGYPWEKNVMPASLQGNGDAKPSNQRAGNIYTSPIVKAAPSNDDIEELTL